MPQKKKTKVRLETSQKKQMCVTVSHKSKNITKVSQPKMSQRRFATKEKTKVRLGTSQSVTERHVTKCTLPYFDKFSTICIGPCWNISTVDMFLN